MRTLLVDAVLVVRCRLVTDRDGGGQAGPERFRHLPADRQVGCPAARGLWGKPM